MLKLSKLCCAITTAFLLTTIGTNAQANPEKIIFKEARLLTDTCLASMDKPQGSFSQLVQHGYTAHKKAKKTTYQKKLNIRQSLLGRPIVSMGNGFPRKPFRCDFSITFLATSTAQDLQNVVHTQLKKQGFQLDKNEKLITFKDGSKKLRVTISALYGTHAFVEIKKVK